VYEGYIHPFVSTMLAVWLFFDRFAMMLTQILQPACINVPLAGEDKTAVIIELIDVLDKNRLLADRDSALDAVLTREAIRSTGIGSGIAIPHGKCAGVRELVMALGVAREGLAFDSVDGKPVFIVILLVSPVDKTGPHIQALAQISRLMLNEELRNALEKVPSAQAAYELLSRHEQE
jgi:fructose-specific phosphotransferase system IIA component